ncbi:MAG: hypothetical protein ACE5EX_04570 [Phycisphaerae bacterium]
MSSAVPEMDGLEMDFGAYLFESADPDERSDKLDPYRDDLEEEDDDDDLFPGGDDDDDDDDDFEDDDEDDL